MRIGIDLGGTKTEIVCLHARNGKELYKHRVPTPKNDYPATVKMLKNLVETAEKTLGQKGTVGMGMPGCVSRDTGLVKNSNALWINGQPLKEDLEKALNREVKIENDANCFAVSEAVDGAAAGKSVVFGVIIGTGCGAGVVVNGQPISGLNGIGGDWGHTPLPYPRVFAKADDVPIQFRNHILGQKSFTPPKFPVYFTDDPDWVEYPGDMSYCGRRGTLEEWVSGTGFKNDYKRVTGEELSTHDIIANYRDGEPKAKAAFERYTDRLARALATAIHILDPDAIVLGGGMSNVDDLYTEVPKIWHHYIFSDYVHTKLLPPRHGDSSGVRGAAWLWGKEKA